MENPLAVSLAISGLGISLLFLTLILFYGLLSLMTAALRERRRPSAHAAEGNDERSGGEEATIQAAVIAVAMARAQAERGAEFLGAPAADLAAGAGLVSPWWTLHHQRQLARNPQSRRTP